MTVNSRRDIRATQTSTSVEVNISFFRDQRDSYNSYVQTLDTYAAIRKSVNEALRGTRRLLDIGNGGVFDYEVETIPQVVALDLFLDQISADRIPSNVRFITGSALDLPVPDSTFDGVIINMLLHHLVGSTVEESVGNARRALSEAMRVLKPGGRLVLIESCVADWCFLLERVVFRMASRAIHLFTSHPLTLQYPPDMVRTYFSDLCDQVDVTHIPKGRWILQYGIKVPGWLTPARPFRFVGQKRLNSTVA